MVLVGVNASRLETDGDCTTYIQGCAHVGLYRFLPKCLAIIGYARSALTDAELREKLKGYLKGDEDKINTFLELCTYQSGQVCLQ